MKTIIYLLLILLSWTYTFSYQNLINNTISNHKVKIIQVNLDWNYKVVSSLSNKGENLQYLMQKENGISAVNGAYFCPKDYSNCWGKNYTNAPRFYKWKNYGKYWDDFSYNGLFAFNKEGTPFIVMNQLWWYAPEKLRNIKYNENKIKDIYYAIGNFPVLLLDWKNIVSYYDKLITWKMKRKWPKSFICYTKDKKTIYMWYVSNINIYELPKFIKDNFWCYGAINLDAGASLWLIYNKKVIKKSYRPVMDAFVVVDNSLEKRRNNIIQKYSALINRFVLKVKRITKWNYKKILAIKNKLNSIKNKYKFEIYVILDEIQKRL